MSRYYARVTVSAVSQNIQHNVTVQNISLQTTKSLMMIIMYNYTSTHPSVGQVGLHYSVSTESKKEINGMLAAN